MATRYASHGTSVRRSIKNSVVAPWWRTPRTTLVTSNVVFPAYGASAHVKGSWTQFTASLSGNSSFIFFSVSLSAGGVDSATLLDIGVGAAGSETVIAQNIAIGGHNVVACAIPVRIASGSRVAVRIQGTRTSPTALSNGLSLAFYNSESHSFLPTSVDVIGTSTTTSYGTTLSGASGSWVEITGSTNNDYQSLFLVPSLATDTVPTTQSTQWSLGVGAAGSEVALMTQAYSTSTAEFVAGGAHLIVGGVPAGSRLAVRHNFSANPERYAACVIGVPYV